MINQVYRYAPSQNVVLNPLKAPQVSFTGEMTSKDSDLEKEFEKKREAIEKLLAEPLVKEPFIIRNRELLSSVDKVSTMLLLFYVLPIPARFLGDSYPFRNYTSRKVVLEHVRQLKKLGLVKLTVQPWFSNLVVQYGQTPLGKLALDKIPPIMDPPSETK